MAVLDVVARSPQPLATHDIAELVGLERTVVHRIIRTLEAEGLTESVAGRHTLGPRNLHLGNCYLHQLPLRQAALPYQIDLLYRVFAGNPWALSIVVRSGRDITLVSQLWAPNAPLDSLLNVGPLVPVDEAAAGRCMLAYTPEPEVVDLIGSTRATELEPHFERIREQGGVDWISAAERPAIPAGIAAISAVIKTRSGRPIAGLTLSGAELHQHLHAGSDVGSRLARTAQQIGQLIS